MIAHAIRVARKFQRPKEPFTLSHTRRKMRRPHLRGTMQSLCLSRLVGLASLLLVFIPLAIAQNAPMGTFEFSVRSFWTYYSVPATITVRSTQQSQPFASSTDEYGRLRLDLPSGDYVPSITAAGYEPSEDFRFRIEPGHVLPVIIVMRPVNEPPELKM